MMVSWSVRLGSDGQSAVKPSAAGALSPQFPTEWCRPERSSPIPCGMRSRPEPVPSSEWTDPRQRRGLWGERVAGAYLASRGWSIEAHRFRLGHQELDLVARRGELVAFVEVKTRTTSAWGAPAESVVWRKRRTITRV